MAEMESSLHQLTTIVTGSTGLQRRVALLERSIDVNGTIRAGNRSRIYPVRTYSMRDIDSTACAGIFLYNVLSYQIALTKNVSIISRVKIN